MIIQAVETVRARFDKELPNAMISMTKENRMRQLQQRSKNLHKKKLIIFPFIIYWF